MKGRSGGWSASDGSWLKCAFPNAVPLAAAAATSFPDALIARQIFDAIRTLNRQDGLTVLIVEQNANHALKLAHRGYVMVNGLITLAGTGAELLQRPEIRAAYLEGGRHG